MCSQNNGQCAATRVDMKVVRIQTFLIKNVVKIISATVRFIFILKYRGQTDGEAQLCIRGQGALSKCRYLLGNQVSTLAIQPSEDV